MAGAVAISVSAKAADLSGPVSSGGGYKDDYVPAAMWTGFYLGVNGGYASGDWKGDFTYLGSADPAFNPGKKVNGDGGFGGGQIGFNKQMSAIVLGFEADIEGAGFEGKRSFNNDNGFFYGAHNPAFTKDLDFKLDYFGTVRGRVGYSFGSVLPYFTGGLAWGHTDSNLTVHNNYLNSIAFITGPSGTGSVSEDHVGWTIGAGVEYAVDPHWSFKVEYLYVDLGTENYRYVGTCNPSVGCPGNVFNTDGFKSDLSFSSVKAGLNYKFGTNYVPLK
jgi:outer membrane immunogenic protein